MIKLNVKLFIKFPHFIILYYIYIYIVYVLIALVDDCPSRLKARGVVWGNNSGRPRKKGN